MRATSVLPPDKENPAGRGATGGGTEAKEGDDEAKNNDNAASRQDEDSPPPPPAVDRDAVHAFCAMAFGYIDGGLIALRGLPEKGRTGATSMRWIQNDASAPDRIGDWCELRAKAGAAAFVIPGVTETQRAGAADIIAAAVIVVDIDDGDIQAKLAHAEARCGPATMIVESGGRAAWAAPKIHAYWRLTEAVEGAGAVAELATLRKALAEKIGGDTAFGKPSQPIRIPGSLHHKGEPAPVTIRTHRPGAEYDLAELREKIAEMPHMPGLEPEPQPERGERERKRDGADDPIPKGMRNKTITKIAGKVIALARLGRRTYAEALGHVILVDATRCRPPLGVERVRAIFESVRRTDAANHGPEQTWPTKLLRTKEGNPKAHDFNVLLAMREDTALRGAVGLNQFTNDLCVLRRLPWADHDDVCPRPWVESDATQLCEWLQSREIDAAPPVVWRCAAVAAAEHGFHPVREYLGGLAWDGAPRLASAAQRYLGAADDARLASIFLKKWLISAVARIFNPGIKADCIVIFEGAQGIGKSSALRILAGDWFRDEVPEIGSKDCALQMKGVWIIEIAELDAFSRAETTKIKAFLSRSIDSYRPPYERAAIDVPRQCVIAGTVNSSQYLRDETGNRRFWPIACGAIDLDALARDRAQILAEAVALYRAGEKWWLAAEEAAEAREAQAARVIADEWWTPISRYLVGATETTVGELLAHALLVPRERWSRADQMRVGGLLIHHGWERRRRRSGGAREWFYVSPLSPPPNS